MRGIIKRIVAFFWGESIFSTPVRPDRTVNALLLAGIEYRPVKRMGETLFFAVKRTDEKKTAALFERYSVVYRIEGRRGLPQLLRRYRCRPGIFLGALLIALLLFISSRYIWDIRVTESDGLREEEILAALESEGITVGSYLPRLDLHEICCLFPLRHPEFGWISVNMMGTVAEIEVRAYRAKEMPAKPEGISALVAAADGVIERLEVYGGQAAVTVGQPVTKGELLVSCLRENFRRRSIENAEGRVFARVTRTLTERVCFSEVCTEPGEAVLLEKCYFLFGKSLKFTKRGSNPEEKCDIIEKSRRVSLFGKYPMPVTVKERYAVPRVETTLTRTEEEAREIAGERLAARTEALFSDTQGQLLSRKIDETVGREALTLTATIETVEDIAVPLPIGYHPTG